MDRNLDALRERVKRTVDIELDDDALMRLGAASCVIEDALRAYVSGSLFDTEPGQLEVVFAALVGHASER